jgi:hypothetical protein
MQPEAGGQRCRTVLALVRGRKSTQEAFTGFSPLPPGLSPSPLKVLPD